MVSFLTSRGPPDMIIPVYSLAHRLGMAQTLAMVMAKLSVGP